MKKITVNSKEEYDHHIKEILSQYRDQEIVFRGQVQDRSLTPSMLRGPSSIRSPGCIPELTANWSISSGRLISLFTKKESTLIATQAIMQHYGYRSFFVDVTLGPDIALWFALHQYKSKRTPMYVNDDLKSAIFQWSYYEPVDSGFVYCLALPKNERYVNLATIMPPAAERIHQQKAGAIFCESGSKSIDEQIVIKIEVHDHGCFKEFLSDIDMNDLFPLPKADIFYRCLCQIPYFIHHEVQIDMAHPLLGFFPIYAESIKNIFLEYAPVTKILNPRPSFGWEVATSVVDLEDTRIKLRSATRITVSSLMIQSISEGITRSDTLNTTCWPSSNLVFEFIPEASLVTPSPEMKMEVIRGLWVIIGSKHLRIAALSDTFDVISIKHECLYTLPELNMQSKSCLCENHNYELEMFVNMTNLLNMNIVTLTWREEYNRLFLERAKVNT